MKSIPNSLNISLKKKKHVSLSYKSFLQGKLSHSLAMSANARNKLVYFETFLTGNRLTTSTLTPFSSAALFPSSD